MSNDHKTPTESETWYQLARTALDIPETVGFLRYGPVEPGTEDKFASRRVWYNQDGLTISHMIVAAYEPQRPRYPQDARPRGWRGPIHREGTYWFSYAIWGCYSCGSGCDRHGDDWTKATPEATA